MEIEARLPASYPATAPAEGAARKLCFTPYHTALLPPRLLTDWTRAGHLTKGIQATGLLGRGLNEKFYQMKSNWPHRMLVPVQPNQEIHGEENNFQ